LAFLSRKPFEICSQPEMEFKYEKKLKCCMSSANDTKHEY
jgi:hypothetical protein